MRNKNTARTEKQKENDRTIIAEMTLKGKNQYQIAEVVGISREQVSRDMKKVRRDWAEKRDQDTTKHIAKELAKLDLVIEKAWDEFDASKVKKETTFKEMNDPNDSSKGSKVYIKKETQNGNPAYLVTIQNCIKKRAELLGLDAPKRTELTGPNGEPLETNYTIVMEYEDVKSKD